MQNTIDYLKSVLVSSNGVPRWQAPFDKNARADMLSDLSMMGAFGGTRDGLGRVADIVGAIRCLYVGGFWDFKSSSRWNPIWKAPVLVTDLPIAWRLRYWAKGWAWCDPAVIRPFQERATVLWRTDEFTTDAKELGFAAREEGYFSGLTIPNFGHGSEIGFVSFFLDDSVFSHDDISLAVRTGLEAFASRFHQSVFAETRTALEKTLRLSAREEEVLRCLIDGLTNLEIAAVLNVSESTIRSSIARMFAKFDSNSRGQLIWTASAMGFPSISSPYTKSRQHF